MIKSTSGLFLVLVLSSSFAYAGGVTAPNEPYSGPVPVGPRAPQKFLSLIDLLSGWGKVCAQRLDDQAKGIVQAQTGGQTTVSGDTVTHSAISHRKYASFADCLKDFDLVDSRKLDPQYTSALSGIDALNAAVAQCQPSDKQDSATQIAGYDPDGCLAAHGIMQVSMVGKHETITIPPGGFKPDANAVDSGDDDSSLESVATAD